MCCILLQVDARPSFLRVQGSLKQLTPWSAYRWQTGHWPLTKCEYHGKTAMGIGKHTQLLLRRETSGRIRTGIWIQWKIQVSHKLGPATVCKNNARNQWQIIALKYSKHEFCNLESPTSESVPRPLLHHAAQLPPWCTKATQWLIRGWQISLYLCKLAPLSLMS